MERNKINAGLYIRVSTDRQVKEGYSIDAQKSSLKKFAQEQNWNIYDIYADEGISGKDIKNRYEVRRLIEDIKNGKIDVVVLYKFDRLTRDSKDTEDIIELIRNWGVQVYTLSGGVIDVSTATGRFSVRISGAVAQLEREQTIERVKFAFAQKAREGYSLASAVTSYGYDRKKHEKNLLINEKEAIIVKRIFDMYLNNKTFTEICNILNLENVPTKKKRKIWYPKTIRLILTNPIYIGKIRYHINKQDEFATLGKHQTIIDLKSWNEVQKRISKIKKVTKTNRPKEDVYFCGILVCGICGAKMTSKRTVKINKDGSKKVYNGYRCINKEKGLCNSSGVSHKKVEKEFFKYLDCIEDLNNINIENLNLDNNDKKELEKLEKLLEKISDKKNKVMNLFLNDKVNDEQLAYMLKKIESQKVLVNNEIEKLRKRDIKKFFEKKDISKKIKDHWVLLSNRERLDFLTNFVEKIVVINKKNKKLNILEIKYYEE